LAEESVLNIYFIIDASCYWLDPPGGGGGQRIYNTWTTIHKSLRLQSSLYCRIFFTIFLSGFYDKHFMFSKKNSCVCIFSDDIYVTLLFGILLLCVFKVLCSMIFYNLTIGLIRISTLLTAKNHKKLMRVHL
jgi:hypothetical protein